MSAFLRHNDHVHGAAASGLATPNDVQPPLNYNRWFYAMCEYECDFDPPTFYEFKTVTGRKQHQCCECLRTIETGEQHEYAKGLWGGDFDTFRTCGTCCAIRDEIELTCYCHGQMMDYLDERDYPGVRSVPEFHLRRRENWQRLYGQRESVIA